MLKETEKRKVVRKAVWIFLWSGEESVKESE